MEAPGSVEDTYRRIERRQTWRFTPRAPGHATVPDVHNWRGSRSLLVTLTRLSATMQFASPWMFLLLVLIPPLIYLRLGQRRAALRFSSTQDLYRTGSSLRQQLLAMPAILRVVALLLLVIALARPQFGVEHVVDVSEGIAIEMVVDRSTSMGEQMSYQGETLTRLDMVKRVFRDFVLGDKKELQRPAQRPDRYGQFRALRRHRLPADACRTTR